MAAKERGRQHFVLAKLEQNILSDKAIPKLLERLNKYQAERDERSSSEIEALHLEAAKADREIANIVEAIAAGFSRTVMAAKLNELEDKKNELETRIAALGSSSGQKKISEEELRGLFGMFRGYIKERNVPEIKKFIGSYIEKVIVYKDHVEVVFFFCAGKDGAGQLRLVAKLSREQLNDGKVA